MPHRTMRTTGPGRLLTLAVVAIVSISTMVIPVRLAAGAAPAGHDPGSTGVWTPRPPLRHARAGLGVVTVDRRILAFGGFDGDTTFAVVESREVSGTGIWHNLMPMPTPRDNFATAVLRGQVYAAGGSDTVGITAVVETYNPRTGQWTTRKPLPRPRVGAGAAVLGGLLYVAGGLFPVGEEGLEVTNSMVVYHSDENTWRTAAPMPTARNQVRLIAAGRFLYAIGGRGTGLSLTTVERYDPRSNSWRTMAPMHERRAAHCVVETTLGTRHVLVVGGGAQFSATGAFVDGLRTTEVYDLATGRWQATSPLLPVVRASMGCAVDATGAILAIGGGTRAGDKNVFLKNVDALLLKPHDIR